MAKTKNEMRIFIGAALIVIGLIGVSRILSILLILAGAYLIYEGVRKK